MTCDVYYDHHPPYDGPGDRCSRDEITAGTATQFSLLGMSTTLFGEISPFRVLLIQHVACYLHQTRRATGD